MNRPVFHHIIFDLGGVIINLDTQLTLKAFAAISGRSDEQVNNFVIEEPVFHHYEKGWVSDAQFREVIRNFSLNELSDQQIDDAWNAMILDLPVQRIALLRHLRSKFDITLLSNTNAIHMLRVNEVRVEAGLPPFEEIFHGDYYSHELGMRKPDADIFEHVLDVHGFNREHTLFIDDSHANIDGARAVGLQTLHVTYPGEIMDFFADE